MVKKKKFISKIVQQPEWENKTSEEPYSETPKTPEDRSGLPEDQEQPESAGHPAPPSSSSTTPTTPPKPGSNNGGRPNGGKPGGVRR